MIELENVRDYLEGSQTIGESGGFWTGFLVVVGILLLLPLVLGSYAVSNQAHLLSFIFLGISLGLIWGYTGIFSFGQVAFFGVAGYIYGIIGINLAGPAGTMLGLLVGLLVAGLFAAVLGYFMFYGGVSDVYVAIITLAVTLVLATFMAGTSGSRWTIGDARLGGFDGMINIPSLAVGAGDAVLTLQGVPFYYFVVSLLVLTYLGLRVLLNTDYGYVMVATRERENRTEMLGYNTKLIKLQVFTFSGVLAGLSGVLYASRGNFINPEVFGLTFAALPVIWVAVGGRKTLLGAILGTYVLQYFSQELAYAADQFATIILGALLVAVILLFPEGAVPQIHRKIVASSYELPRIGVFGGVPDEEENR